MNRVTLAGAVATSIIVAYVVAWLGLSPIRERGSDFSVGFTAARVWIDDGRGVLYDQSLEARRHRELEPDSVRLNLPYVSPPLVAVAEIPLLPLGPELAFRLFSAAQVAMLVAAAVIATPRRSFRRRAEAIVIALAGAGTLPLLVLGQWDGLGALAIALAWRSWHDGHPGRAGLLLVLLGAFAKPHLLVGILLFAVGRRELRALWGVAAGAAILVAATLAAAGPGVVGAFAMTLGTDSATTPPAGTLGLLGLAASWLGNGTLAYAVYVILAVATGAASLAAGRASRSFDLTACDFTACFASATLASLALPPHVLAHDLAILVPVVAALIVRRTGRRRNEVIAAWVVLTLATVLDAGNGQAAPPGRIVPLLLVAGAVWLWRSSTTTTGSGRAAGGSIVAS